MKKIGVVADIKGLKGGLKVKLFEDKFVEFFEIGEKVSVKIANEVVSLNVVKHRKIGNRLVELYLDKIDTSYLSEFMLDLELYIDNIEGEEHYHSYDYIDFSKYSLIINGKSFKIEEIYHNNEDEYISCSDGEKSLIVPFKDEFIDRIDGYNIITKNLEGFGEV